jgi:hypothetical protein
MILKNDILVKKIIIQSLRLTNPVYLIVSHLPLHFLTYASLSYKAHFMTFVGLLVKVKNQHVLLPLLVLATRW